MLYRIKPLEWKNRTNEIVETDLVELHEAKSPVCTFGIQKMKSEDWFYHFCFDEYYDDGGGSCENLEDGKAKCEKIWVDKLKKCLITKGK